jgi:hypothetical protein
MTSGCADRVVVSDRLDAALGPVETIGEVDASVAFPVNYAANRSHDPIAGVSSSERTTGVRTNVADTLPCPQRL